MDVAECAASLRRLEGQQFYTTQISRSAYKLSPVPENRIPASVDFEALPENIPFYLNRSSSDLFDVIADGLVFKDQETLDQYDATQGNFERSNFLVDLSEDSMDVILASEDGLRLQEFLNDATVSEAWTLDEFEGAREALMSISHIIGDLSVLNENLHIDTPVESLFASSLRVIKHLSPANQQFIISAKRCLDTFYPNKYENTCDPVFEPEHQEAHDFLLHVLRCFVGYHNMGEYLTQISQSL